MCVQNKTIMLIYNSRKIQGKIKKKKKKKIQGIYIVHAGLSIENFNRCNSYRH